MICSDPDATSALGRALGAVAEAGDLVCLWGDLGAGKTHLAKAFGAALGVTETVTSPSFILMAEYEGRLPLFHIDPYRLASAEDALAGGLIDERQATGVTLVEWPERLGDALPARSARRPDRRDRGRAAHDHPDRMVRSLSPLPRGGPVTHDGRRPRHPRHRHRDDARRHRDRYAGGRRRRGLDLARRVPPRRDAAALDRAVPRRAEHPTIAPCRHRRRDGAGRVHRAAGRHRHRQGARPRAGHPARRRLDRRGAARRIGRPRRPCSCSPPGRPTD